MCIRDSYCRFWGLGVMLEGFLSSERSKESAFYNIIKTFVLYNQRNSRTRPVTSNLTEFGESPIYASRGEIFSPTDCTVLWHIIIIYDITSIWLISLYHYFFFLKLLFLQEYHKDGCYFWFTSLIKISWYILISSINKVNLQFGFVGSWKIRYFAGTSSCFVSNVFSSTNVTA